MAEIKTIKVKNICIQKECDDSNHYDIHDVYNVNGEIFSKEDLEELSEDIKNLLGE